ncbi:YjzC family protein [Neobacillus dielmonensis]|uniref:YjzC family protein n=1 Tax=Neobacillus dielmonensis TaxID=1347369 RepID=UPI0005A91A84|nr:YjzC family protein [Neobacillus dielmonensis]
MAALKPGEIARQSGVYVEVGHGGGKVKNARRVEVKQGESLPELKPYTITIEHKGIKKTRTRQHSWRLE